MPNGIRIAQAGVPVARAADYQKTMDERWPLLTFAFQGIIDLTVNQYSAGALRGSTGVLYFIPIYKHNLGFVPGFRIRNIRSSGQGLFNETIESNLYADETYIYVLTYDIGTDPTVRVKIWLGVFAQNFQEEFVSPIDHAQANQTSSTSPFGVRILKDYGGQGISERNKVGYSLNTNAKSMAIHRHGTALAASGSIIVDHFLSYPPTYYLAELAYKDPATGGDAWPILNKYLSRPFGTVVGLVSSTGIRINIKGGQAALTGKYMYVIVKDPVDVAR